MVKIDSKAWELLMANIESINKHMDVLNKEGGEIRDRLAGLEGKSYILFSSILLSIILSVIFKFIQ